MLFLGLILLSHNGIAQKVGVTDTLRFAADTSYSRIVVRYKKNMLLFGTSKSGVIAFSEKTKSKKSIPLIHLLGKATLTELMAKRFIT